MSDRTKTCPYCADSGIRLIASIIVGDQGAPVIAPCSHKKRKRPAPPPAPVTTRKRPEWLRVVS